MYHDFSAGLIVIVTGAEWPAFISQLPYNIKSSLGNNRWDYKNESSHSTNHDSSAALQMLFTVNLIDLILMDIRNDRQNP